MDDILVYSHTLSNHQQIICQVLSTLRKQRLFLKPEKCKFEQKEVEYLRLVISKDHVAMDPTKVHRVTEWPTPMKVKEVQSLLGFVNFYQKFICDFSDIAHSMHSLTRPCSGSGVDPSRRRSMPWRSLSPLPPSSPFLSNPVASSMNAM